MVNLKALLVSALLFNFEAAAYSSDDVFNRVYGIHQCINSLTNKNLDFVCPNKYSTSKYKSLFTCNNQVNRDMLAKGHTATVGNSLVDYKCKFQIEKKNGICQRYGWVCSKK
ncbi:MAG: hypothetical protein RL348_1081 [Bacteroidota bacterium]|jgi:hypothetical protein